MTAATGATTATTSANPAAAAAGDAIVKPRRGTIASRYLAAIIGTNGDGRSDVPVTAQAAAAAAASAAFASSSKSDGDSSGRKDDRTMNSYNNSGSNLSNLAGLVSSGFDCSTTAPTAALDQSESWTTQGTRYSTKTSNSTSAAAAAAAVVAHVHTPARGGTGAGVGGWSSSKLGYNSPHNNALNTTSTTVATTPTNSRPTTPVRFHTPGSASVSSGNKPLSWRSSSSNNNNSSSNSPHHNHHLPPPGTSTAATSILSVDSATTGEDFEDIDVLGEIIEDDQKSQQQQALSTGLRNRLNCSTLQGWQSEVVTGGNDDGNNRWSSRSGSQSQFRPRSTTPTNNDRSSHSSRSSRSTRSHFSSTSGGSRHSERFFPRTTDLATRTSTQGQHLSNPYDLKKTPDSSITVRHSNRGHDRGMELEQEHQHQHRKATGGSLQNDPYDDDSRFSNDEGDILVKSSDAGAATEVMTNRTSDVLTRVRDKLLSDTDADVDRRGSHESSLEQRHPDQDELKGPPQLQRTHISLPIIKEDLTSRASIPTNPSSTILMHNNNEQIPPSRSKKSSMKEKIVPSLIDACNSESMSMSTAPDNESYATDNGVIGAVNPQNLRLPRNTQSVHQMSVASPSPPESASFQILNTKSNSLATSTMSSVFDGIDLGPSFSSVQAEQGIPGSQKTNEYMKKQAGTRPEQNTSIAATTSSQKGNRESNSRGRVAALGAHLRKAKWTVRGARTARNEVEEPLLSAEEEGKGNMAYDNAAVVATYNPGSSHHERIVGHFDDDESTLPEQRAGVDRSADFIVYNKRVAANAKDVFQSKGFDNYDDSPTKNTEKAQDNRRDQFHGNIQRGKSPIQPLFSLDRLNLSHDAGNSPIRKSRSTSSFPVENPIHNISDSDQQQDDPLSATRPQSSSFSRSLEEKFSKEKSTSSLVREALARHRAPVVAPKTVEDPDNDLDEELVHIMESSGQKTNKLSTTLESRPVSAPSSARTSKIMVSPSSRVSAANDAAYSDHNRRYNEGSKGELLSLSASKQASVRDKIRVFSSPSPVHRRTEEIAAPRKAMNTKPSMEEEKKDDEDSFFFPAGIDNDDGSVKSLREKIEQDLGMNRMPSPVQHVGGDEDDFSVQSLRNRLEERINKVNENDDELEDDNSVRSLREKFEQPIVRHRGENVSSLRAMFESKPKQSVVPLRPISSSHSGKTLSRPPLKQNIVLNEQDVVDTTDLPPTDDNVSPDKDSREYSMSGQKNCGAMEEATALLGAYRARERKRELEATIHRKSGSALESAVDQSTNHLRATPEQNANSSVQTMRTRLDQWTKDRQRERGSDDSPSNMIPGTDRNHEEPRSKTSVIPARPSESNPDANQHTNTDKNDMSIFKRGDQNESYGDDGQNIVPGSHWTTKGNGRNSRISQPISTKGSSSDSDYSDAVTLDASIADVSILTNPSAIRSKESKDVDDKDRHSDTSSSILSTTKKSETSSTQLSEAATPLLAASMLPTSDEASRDHKRGDMWTLPEAAIPACAVTTDVREKNIGECFPTDDEVEPKSIPVLSPQTKTHETGDTWVAFPRKTTTPEPMEKEQVSSSMENWPDFEDEKEWTEDADGNYVAASSTYQENSDCANKTSLNFDVENHRFSSAGRTPTSTPNSHHMSSYVSSQSEHTGRGRKSADVDSSTSVDVLQDGKLLAESQEAGSKSPSLSTHQRPPKTKTERYGPRVVDYEQQPEDYGPSREVMRYTGTSNFSAASPAPIAAAPAVPPVPSPLDPDYETLMSSRHKMLLSRQRALQHRRASRARANIASSPPPTQGGFFGRTHPDRSHTPDPPSLTHFQNPPSPRSMHSARSLPNYQSPALAPSRSVGSRPKTPPRSTSPHSMNSMPKMLSDVRTPPRSSNEAKIYRRSAVTGFDPFGFPVYNNIDDSDQKAFEALTRPSKRGSRDPEGVRVADMPVNTDFISRRTSYSDSHQRQQSSDGSSLYSKVKSRFSLPSPLSTTFRRQQNEISQSEAVIARISAVRAARLRRLHAYGERHTSNSSPMSGFNHNNLTQRRSPTMVPKYRYYTHDDEKEDEETNSMQATGPGEEDMSLSTNNSNSPQDFAAHLAVD